MSDTVFITGQNRDNAILLLAAAEELEQDASVVATAEGGYNVPVEVAEQAGFDKDGRPKSRATKRAAQDEQDSDEQPAKKAAPRRRRATKKAAASEPAKPAGDDTKE